MLEIICQAAPVQKKRANEDTFVAYQRADESDHYVLAAIDGATSVAFYEPLMRYLDEARGGITPAGLAASVTRDSILSALGQSNGLSFRPSLSGQLSTIQPRQLLLHANAALRDLLKQEASGIFETAAIKAVNPEYADFLDDPRKIRLFLPAAVATLAVIDRQAKTLHYAQVGDTALVLGYPDGSVEVPTRDRVTAKYETALFVAIRQVAGQGLSMLDMLNHPLIESLDRNNRIYHNFVNRPGHPVPSQGIGVINGLPALEAYIKTGVISLDGVAAVILATDGFLWPDNPLDSQEDYRVRMEQMWRYVREYGAAHYLRKLRTEERADASREKYPRLKLHDDATGLVLTLET